MNIEKLILSGSEGAFLPGTIAVPATARDLIIGTRFRFYFEWPSRELYKDYEITRSWLRCGQEGYGDPTRVFLKVLYDHSSRAYPPFFPGKDTEKWKTRGWLTRESMLGIGNTPGRAFVVTRGDGGSILGTETCRGLSGLNI